MVGVLKNKKSLWHGLNLLLVIKQYICLYSIAVQQAQLVS